MDACAPALFLKTIKQGRRSSDGRGSVEFLIGHFSDQAISQYLIVLFLLQEMRRRRCEHQELKKSETRFSARNT